MLRRLRRWLDRGSPSSSRPHSEPAPAAEEAPRPEPPAPSQPLAAADTVTADTGKVASYAPIDAEPAAPTNESSDNALSLAQPAAERLAEDERLRGSLTDEGYGAVLTWVTNLLVGAAERASAGPRAEAVMEAAGDAAVELIRAVVAAAESGETDSVAGSLRPPLVSPDESTRVQATELSSTAATSDPDARARAIVAALSAVAPGSSGGAR